MKEVNQYRDELIGKISAEVMSKLSVLIVSKLSQYEIEYDDKIADAMIEMYTEGLNEGLSRATEVMQHAMIYKATLDLLKGGNHNE